MSYKITLLVLVCLYILPIYLAKMSLCILKTCFLLRLLEINTSRKATPVTSITATIMNIKTPATAPAIEELASVSPVALVGNGVTIDEVVPEVKKVHL